jgi:hypothetical protein
MDSAHIVILAALVIGLIYGAVGLLSGFCMMSGLRGWWAQGDGRLVRTYALAMGVGIAASQLLAARGMVDLGKSIYLQPSFSAPVMFLGGLLFGYGMVLSNGCGSRALVLLGRGNLRFRRDDVEGLDCAGAYRDGAGVAVHGETDLGAGAAVVCRAKRGIGAHARRLGAERCVDHLRIRPWRFQAVARADRGRPYGWHSRRCRMVRDRLSRCR